jgi:hypothetical protein
MVDHQSYEEPGQLERRLEPKEELPYRELRRESSHWWDDALSSYSTTELAPLTMGALRVIFDELTARWRAETQSAPVSVQRETHFAYQQIIGLGEPVLPLILENLRSDANDWFWALIAITRFNVAEGVSDVDEATARWLAWGRNTGQIGVST